MIESLVFFIAITLLNIISSTVKTVMVVKSSPITAGIISAVNYTINAVAVLTIAKQSTEAVIIVAFCGNLVGVTGTKFIMDLLERDQLWVYNATIRCGKTTVEGLRNYLKELYGIHSIWEPIVEHELYSMRFFVYTKEHSKVLKDQLDSLDAKYYIIEPR